jgi:hypothetical protein
VGAEVVSTWRDPSKALGAAVGDSFDIVSLGRGGEITLTFDRPITNGQGWDFAVFENSFSDTFLELAIVEVSSDGVTYAAFETDSLTANPVGGFGAIEPSNIDGFAGKYRQGFGTPFDLSDLATQPEVLSGDVDLSAITHVRLLDVVGDGSDFDTSGDVIYDPYPTFQSAGFDLDAVGVRYEQGVNSPPDEPSLLSPADGAMSVALNVTLRSSGFTDPDAGEGDIHFQTRWQVATDAAFNTSVLDLTSPVSLTELQLSEAILAASTLYFWRVQYFDGRGGVSPFSATFSFQTTVLSGDGDGNGIPDAQELPAGSPVDLNGDLIADVTQITDQYKVLASAAGSGQLSVALSNLNAAVEFVEAVNSNDLPDGDQKPANTLLGFLSMRLRVENIGDSETITVYLSKVAPEGYQWFKYDDIRGWRALPQAVFSADRRSVVMTLTDGGDTDGDGQADGFILDPGGVGLAAGDSGTGVPASGARGVGGGGCFISACCSDASPGLTFIEAIIFRCFHGAERGTP